MAFMLHQAGIVSRPGSHGLLHGCHGYEFRNFSVMTLVSGGIFRVTNSFGPSDHERARAWARNWHGGGRSGHPGGAGVSVLVGHFSGERTPALRVAAAARACAFPRARPCVPGGAQASALRAAGTMGTGGNERLQRAARLSRPWSLSFLSLHSACSRLFPGFGRPLCGSRSRARRKCTAVVSGQLCRTLSNPWHTQGSGGLGTAS